MEFNKKQSKAKWIIIAACTGLINGLFGAGGGMLAVVVLERMWDLPCERAHATALMVMLPLSLISIVVYLLRGAVEWTHVPWVALGMLPGSFLGAKLLARLKAIWIDRLFCLLMAAAGIRLLF